MGSSASSLVFCHSGFLGRSLDIGNSENVGTAQGVSPVKRLEEVCMSGRTAPPTQRLRATRALSLGLLVGVGCGALVGLPARAQSPLPAETTVDQKSPL